MDIFLLIFTGVLIFLIGQYILRLIVEPAIEAKKTVAKAWMTFSFFLDIASNPIAGEVTPDFREAQRKASRELRRTAGELQAIPYSIVGYQAVRKLFGLPPAERVTRGARGFMGLSNALFGSGGAKYAFDLVQRNIDGIRAAFDWPET